MNGFIVLEKGYEYNDEIYSEPEGGGGSPKRIFLSRPDAQEYLKELNYESYKENDLEQYAYDIEDVLNVSLSEIEEFIKKLDDKYGKSPLGPYERSGGIKLHKLANSDECNEYDKMVGITFYEISEVEIDTQSLRDNNINNILK
jgi:hypothetical protein